jgi:AcrR family transcriptional regulator
MARPRSDIQPRIVHAARARFLEDGVDGASLREIARDAGTNLGMIVYYYPTKDDLFLAVVEEVYAKLLADMEAILTAEGTTRERLFHAFVRIGSVADDELAVLRLMAREALVSSTRFRQILERSRRGHLRTITRALADGVAQGELEGGVPPPLLLVCTMALGGFPQLLRRAAGSEPPFAALPGPETLAQISVDLLFRAIGAAPPRGRERQLRRPGGPTKPTGANKKRTRPS